MTCNYKNCGISRKNLIKYSSQKFFINLNRRALGEEFRDLNTCSGCGFDR